MNYNEYDSNGNKQNFNLSDILSDKKKRARFFLLIYLVIFILLVIFVRMNIKSSTTYKENKEENIEQNNNNQENTEEIIKSDDMFSYIDMKNYDFTYTINMDDNITNIEGKRFNDKYSFTVASNDSVIYFNGTSNYIKARETLDGEYKYTGFPYALVNIFDTEILKEIINSSELKENVYEITTEKIGKIVKNNTLSNKDAINTIELVKKNNKVTEIIMNLSNAISSYTNNNTSINITLKYSNFGLVDDFKIE